MHNKWEEAVPLYLVGLLLPDERLAFERHASGCEICRQTLEEWRTVAAVVHDAGQQWSKGLPPLAPEIRARVAAGVTAGRPSIAAPTLLAGKRVAGEQKRRQERRQSPARVPMPVTLVAAAAAVVIVGAVLLLMRGGAPTLEVAVAVQANDGAGADEQPPGTADAPAATVTGAGDLGIMPVATATLPPTSTAHYGATALPTRTVVPPPTSTALPYGGGGTGDILPTLQVESALLPVDPTPGLRISPAAGQCQATAANGLSGSVYATAAGIEVIATLLPGEWWNVIVTDNSGWYFVVNPGIGTTGWVYFTDIELRGENCEQIPLPSPTYTSTAVVTNDIAECLAVNLIGVDLPVYSAAFMGADVVATIAAGGSVRPLTRRADGWLEVEAILADGTGVTGYVLESYVRLEGACDTLP